MFLESDMAQWIIINYKLPAAITTELKYIFSIISVFEIIFNFQLYKVLFTSIFHGFRLDSI